MVDRTRFHKEYQLQNKKILWFWDESNHHAEEMMVNNLYVCDAHYQVLWNMLNVQGFDDVCTGLDVREDQFSFFTFSGCRITVAIEDFQIIEKMLVR